MVVWKETLSTAVNGCCMSAFLKLKLTTADSSFAEVHLHFCKLVLEDFAVVVVVVV